MPRGVYPRKSPLEAFWSHVDPCRTDGCALWVAAIEKGYGVFHVARRKMPAHHFLIGKPPPGLVWDHVKARGCTHTACIWPEHLEAVTQAENVHRGDTGANNGLKTHCPKGHAYDAANTYAHPRGSRICRLCHAQQERERRLRQ